MLFCTEPVKGKFLTAIGERAQRAERDAGQGVAKWLLGGVEAGAQWELLPEGRRPDGPIQVRRNMTKHEACRFACSVIAEYPPLRGRTIGDLDVVAWPSRIWIARRFPVAL
jgi:hypothetical protein